MKKKTRKTKLLPMVLAIALAGNTAVCINAEAVKTVDSDAKSAELEVSVCKPEEHIWSEWTVVTEANCTTEALEKRICKECRTEETRILEVNDAHEMVSDDENADEDTQDPMKDPELTPMADPDEAILDPDIPADDKAGTDEWISEADNEPEEELDNEPEEELPEIDPDTIDSDFTEFDWDDEEYLTYASCTSTEIVTEYDPETAVSTIEVAKDPEKPEETESVEGMTVPGGTTKIIRDAEGNLTDVAISLGIYEVRNGFSLSSDAGTLHSITLRHRDFPSMDWITLTAKKPASDLGIRLYDTGKEMILSMSENKKILEIVKVENEEDSIVLTMSEGSICRINQKIRRILAEEETFSDRINQVRFCLNEDGVWETKFEYVEKDRKETEMLYWIVPYEDIASEPIVITVYKDTEQG